MSDSSRLILPKSRSQGIGMSIPPSPMVYTVEQEDKDADEKGYITNRLAICSTAVIASDIIIQFITFKSENTSGGKWDCGQEIVW